MNIRNRIIRLEKENNPHGFCKCKQTLRFETYYQDLTKDSESTEEKLRNETVPGKCKICQKPIDKRVFVIQLVDAESVKIC